MFNILNPLINNLTKSYNNHKNGHKTLWNSQGTPSITKEWPLTTTKLCKMAVEHQGMATEHSTFRVNGTAKHFWMLWNASHAKSVGLWNCL